MQFNKQAANLMESVSRFKLYGNQLANSARPAVRTEFNRKPLGKSVTAPRVAPAIINKGNTEDGDWAEF